MLPQRVLLTFEEVVSPIIRFQTEWSPYFMSDISQNAWFFATFGGFTSPGPRSCYYVFAAFWE
jgi:hypothetical protein